MSLKCGGVGINLVRCSHVVNMDLAVSHLPALDPY